jgi:DNA-binding HxlR family transcriptional regulator
VSRLAYTRAIRARLANAGFDGVSRAGVRMIGQLVEALAQRDYISRAPDPEDRRRSVVALTDRGRAASEVVREASETLAD